MQTKTESRAAPDAWDIYLSIERQAMHDRINADRPAMDEYERIASAAERYKRAGDCATYWKIENQASAALKLATAQTQADYDRIERTAYAEYLRAKAAAKVPA